MGRRARRSWGREEEGDGVGVGGHACRVWAKAEEQQRLEKLAEVEGRRMEGRLACRYLEVGRGCWRVEVARDVPDGEGGLGCTGDGGLLAARLDALCPVKAEYVMVPPLLLRLLPAAVWYTPLELR